MDGLSGKNPVFRSKKIDCQFGDIMKKTFFLNNARYLDPLCRWILGSIFIYASLDKLFHPADFAQAVYSYQILPDIFINIFAIILPWIELTCGVLLIIGFFKKGSILIINLLLITFLVAMTINLFRGLETGCGCFDLGNTSDRINISYLFRDLLLIGMGAYLYFSNVTSHRWRRDSSKAPSM